MADPNSTTDMIVVCTAPLPAANATGYTVTATYSGDGNFLYGAPGTVNQVVAATTTTTNLSSSPAAPVANQQVNFTATVTPKYTGTAPAGTVVFTDKSTTPNTVLCTKTLSGGSATCPHTFLTATPAGGPGDTIEAAFTPSDTNFTAQTTPPTIQQPIGLDPTMVTLSSSNAMSVATQPVTFTATLTPTFAMSTVPPTGSISFTLTQGTASFACPASALAPVGQLPAVSFTATCQVTFGANVGGAITIAANYTGDGNFALSGSGAGSQTVQNFAVSAGTTSTSIFVTQGYSNTSDPFFNVAPATQTISATLSRLDGFADTLTATCLVGTPANVVTDPSCTPPTTGTAGLSLPNFVVSASSTAAVGAYPLTLGAKDTGFGLAQTASPITVYVLSVNSTLSLTNGASGSENVIFNTGAPTAAGATLSTFACTQIFDGKAIVPQSSPLLKCSATPTPVSGPSTNVVVTMTAGTVKTAQIARSSTIYAALVLGVPLFALLGIFGAAKWDRKIFIRILSLVVLLVGLSYATGCGGGFTPPPVPVTPGLPNGSYLVQVVATDGNQNNYYATVPLVITGQ
jgi:hypothetical protein